MPLTRTTRYLVLLITLLGITAPHRNLHAQQQSDKVQSLGEILNPQTGEYGANLTPEERGNAYYKKCMQTESLAFDAPEKKILCACTGSHIGEILTGPEFAQLYKDTLRGRDARMKVITYAYTDCMDYVIQSKILADCGTMPILKTLVQGQKQVCRCTADLYKKLIHEGAPSIIIKAVKYDPMTLNPLEQYFTTDAYYQNLENYTETCRSQLLYERNN